MGNSNKYDLGLGWRGAQGAREDHFKEMKTLDTKQENGVRADQNHQGASGTRLRTLPSLACGEASVTRACVRVRIWNSRKRTLSASTCPI